MINLILLFFCLSLSSAEENLDIGFHYGLLSKPAYDSGSNTVLSDSSTIHSGDFLRINIGYSPKTNFCVIYKGASGEYILLDNKEMLLDEDISFEQETAYFTALHPTEMGPPSGSETFYFINSIGSLSELTSLLNRYDKAPEKGKIKLASKIESKINSYDPDSQDDLSSLSSALDKPVAGGVAFRGEGDEIKDLSVTHKCLGAGGIAFKKIVLIHQ